MDGIFNNFRYVNFKRKNETKHSKGEEEKEQGIPLQKEKWED